MIYHSCTTVDFFFPGFMESLHTSGSSLVASHDVCFNRIVMFALPISAYDRYSKHPCFRRVAEIGGYPQETDLQLFLVQIILP